jgi:hypothetical protein
VIVALYSPAARGKLPTPEPRGTDRKLSVHLSTEPGQLHRVRLTSAPCGADPSRAPGVAVS